MMAMLRILAAVACFALVYGDEACDAVSEEELLDSVEELGETYLLQVQATVAQEKPDSVEPHEGDEGSGGDEMRADVDARSVEPHEGDEGSGGDELRADVDARPQADGARMGEEPLVGTAVLLEAGSKSNETRNGLASWQTEPIVFDYPDGSTTDENYCHPNDRERMWRGAEGTWQQCQQACAGYRAIQSAWNGLYPCYWYTQAQPGTSQMSKCTCCHQGARVYKSGIGNQIYAIAYGC